MSDLDLARRHAKQLRSALLTGTSFAVLLMTAPTAHARSLNGGSTAPSAPTIASDAAAYAAQQAAAAGQQTQQSLARAAKAMQDMQAVQAAARAAAAARQTSLAAPVSVPNGLGAGGLLPNMPAGWSGANAPTQGVDASGQTQVGIRQTQSRAILNWTSFNVGARTTLSFDQQGNSNWVALNRVNATTGPSQILGNIKADGQVYVINQSGIIFGGASQINVGSLIASTAGIVDPATIYSAQVGRNYVPSFAGAGDGGTGSLAGKVLVEPGAQLSASAPTSVTSGGGYVLLLGTAVTNAGSITAPKGQVALAAGHDFIIRAGLGTDANQHSTTRGSEIVAGTWSGGAGTAGTWVAGGGTVSNSGIAFAQQGDITLTGHAILQDGFLLSTTSVNQRGTIHLLNAASDMSGSITLTGNSQAVILPELISTDTALNSQRDALIASASPNLLAAGQFDNLSLLADRPDQSRIEIVTGGLVYFQNGSSTAAQGGQIVVSAKTRIFTESGVTLDVSGVRDVALTMASNNIKVNLQGNELRDSPQNRDSSVLKNNDVWIDIRELTLVPAGTGGYGGDRYYTKGGLLEVGGYLANSAHTIGEWAAVGGSITLSAPEVIAQRGAVFDISGGSLDYAGGWIRSTNLIGSDGRRYSVDDAPANMTFTGFAGGFTRTHNIQGKVDDRLTETWTSVFDRGRTSVRWEDGYTVGRDAGQLILSTPTLVFEGDILADVIFGVRQTSARAAGVTDGYKFTQNTAPVPGTLALGQYDGYGLAGGYNTDVRFGSVAAIASGMNATSALPSDRANTAWFDVSALNGFGLGGANIASGGQVAVDAPLRFAPGAQVKLVAPVVDIQADITAPSGSVTVSNILKAATGTVAFTTADGGAQLTLEAGVTIDTRGLWINTLINPRNLPGLAFLNGGNVTFDSTQNVTLAEGSVIDVSSGGAVLANGKTQGGKGGNVTIKAGDAQQNAGTGDGTLILGGRIRAWGVTGGGTLTISSPGNIVIGDNAELAGGTLAAGTPAPVALTLKQALTIPAGTPLPFTLIETATTITFDTPTLADITLDGPPSGPTGADWQVPGTLGVWTNDGNCYGGWPCGSSIVPAGSIITGWTGSGRIPAGTVVPSNVFPSGLPVKPYQVIYAAGSVLATSKTYAVGAVIPAGTVLAQTIAVAPAPALNSSFFTAGFANYDINGGQGVLVANNSAVAPAMPVYRFSADSYAVRSGGDPSLAMSLWTPPLFIENAANGTLTQRGGVSLTLRSQSTRFSGANSGGGSIVVGEGASISVDPGQSITLSAFGQLTVLGDLTARGGSITLANVADGSQFDAGRNFDAQGNGRGVSIWIDALARLDVSGLAYGASDLSGRPYGKATDGGAIAISGGGAFVIIRPGAELNADGVLVPIDLAAGRSARAPSQPLAWATNGGSIALSSSSGLYLDGDMHAVAGGANASGGSLSVALVTPSFVTQSFPNSAPPANALVPSTMVVTQAYQPSSLPSDIAPGTDASSLQFGHAAISVEKIKAGGFDSLTLKSGDFMQFSGDVSLSLGRSLTLTAAAFTAGNPFTGDITSAPSIATNSVKLFAPYIRFVEPQAIIPDGFDSGSVHNPRASGAPTAAIFEADADQIDIQGLVQFGARANVYDPAIGWRIATNYPGFVTTRLKSQGDIRFLNEPTAPVPQGTQLATDWNLELLAAQIYPATNTFATVIAGQSNPNNRTASPPKLIIGRTTDSIPHAPLSAFGSLAFQAPIVEQGGIVRAPFGFIQLGRNFDDGTQTQRIDLLPGSLTSVSMDGLVIPYGGTIDGVTYNYNGAAVKPLALTNTGPYGVQSGIVLDGQSVNVAGGAVLDMSGGGTLSGAGFVSGRGGSVNVLNTPLVNANPTTPLSKASDKVYAIVPGYRSGYAPVAPENGAGDPLIGQQITVPSGVPGLPAGTYTLLPSNYALLPGAFRVELGGTTMLPIAGAIGNGTYATSVYTGFANTAIKSSLPVTALITSGTSVRSYSQYNDQSYSDFLIANTAQFGGVRPLLPADGKALMLTFEAPTSTTASSALTFDGTALFQAAPGGAAGQVLLQNVSEIYSDPSTAAFTGSAVDANAINALGAPRLIVNGYAGIFDGVVTFQGGGDIAIRDGVTLKAGEIFLVGGDISVGNNVTLTTIGQGAAPFDSASTGMSYTTSYGVSVLALSNGDINFLGNGTSNGAITVGANSQLYAEGTLAFATNGVSSLDTSAHFGARNIALAVGTLNIGDAATIAAAGAPAGFLFSQEFFNLLINGDPLHGAPALEKITLSAANAINVFGNSGLDATGTGVNLVLNTSAIYGYGTAGDQATIAAGKIVWNGIPGATPPAIAASGPGTGVGTLNLVADEIDFGRFVSLDTTTSSRVIYGFTNVNIAGRTQIVSAGNSKLFIYQAPSSDPAAVFGQSGVNGNLTLTTPLITGVQKSIMAYTAGGALNVVAPAGIAPSAATSAVAGAEINLTGDSVAIASTVLLPSGKLVVNATNDIALNSGSRIDLSGRPSTIQRAPVHGFGGIAIFNSAQGSVTQAAGAVIDVSATNANAGSVTIDARNGAVVLGGRVKGTANDGFVSGDFSVAAGTLGDFAGLNALLTQGGFFDARSFDVKTGDLIIGDGVKARSITVSVDSGSLTVNGTIDASGAAPGTIRLSAGNGLTLASSAVLDAHGTLLQVDSYGQPIEARNRGHIELTAAGGTLTLSPGATMDLTAPNGVAYGDIQLNAQRTGETSGDIAINASGPLNIRGAYSIALNAFWTYDLPGGSTITQATLDGYDTASTAFINAALGNADLSSRVAGLSAYGSAYHLRPGVQITSSGDLSTSGDIDLAKYRYGAGADRDPNSAAYGAGEPMALVIRAAGNVTVNGSISDGFKAGTGTPPSYTAISASDLSTDTIHFVAQGTAYWRLVSGNVATVTNPAGWTVPYRPGGIALVLPFRPQGADGTTYASGTVIPFGTQLVRLYIPTGDEVSVTGLSLQTSAGSPGAAATSAAAPMLAPGSLSASIRLVSGADLAAADQRALQTTRTLNGSGNLTLSDPAYNSSLNGTFFSVLRTGTGNLDLLAGGSFSEATPYGVYTAGTQSAAVLAADGSNPYDLLGVTSGGNSHAWYTEHGGDVLLSAQLDLTGNIQIADYSTRYVDSDITSNWLFRQGGGSSADPTAWWVNFGSYAKTSAWSDTQQLVGFQGIGTLGGGNLTVVAGRDAGVMSNGNGTSSGLDLAVASTGRVLADGSVVETGGGNLVLKVGGVLNPLAAASATSLSPDYFGSVTNLRGDIVVSAGSIGTLAQNNSGLSWTSYDPRALDPSIFKRSLKAPGPIFTPGDGAISITARGDLVFGGAGDATMAASVDLNGNAYTVRNGDGTTTIVKNGGQSSFTLWTPTTAIDLYAAGGDIAVLDGNVVGSSYGTRTYPATLIVAAANGDIRFAEPGYGALTFAPIELMPSPNGQLALLAAGSIFGTSQIVSMSGADMSTLATPFRPVFYVNNDSNASANAAFRLDHSNPIAFGEDTPVSNLHAGDSLPALVYAGVDIVDLTLGQAVTQRANIGARFNPTHSTWYLAAKPFEVIAGRDIVGTGPTPSVFLNVNASDITFMQAGRDIFHQSADILGPGLLQVQAGRNLYQGYYGTLVSVGDVVNPANNKGGAGITVLAGVGANGPDYTAFAKLYFDPANQLADGAPLADSGKVARAYDQELLQWLQNRFGYAGKAADALAFFLTLPKEQQGVFVREVYYKELTLGGREYNNSESPRYLSYLRGRQAIATLFPDQDAQGAPVTYAGQITMFSGLAKNALGNFYLSDAGVRTQFGGDIQILNPGGRTLIGVEGVSPGAGAGLITQGQNSNIDVYSLGSVLLGQSRIMTTFGGDILVWSAEGDINAGRGSKTTVIYTPPLVAYDKYGHLSLSPPTPSSGAGIATLNPIAGTRPSNIDLIAPRGTIDAGEAGIRVSGNINLAALQVLNAANIQVQGTSTGIPTVQAPSISAALSISNATAATQQTATPSQGSGNAQPSVIIVDVLGYGGGSEQDSPSRQKERNGRQSDERQSYDPSSMFQVVGSGALSDDQKQKLTDDEKTKMSIR